MDHYIPYGFKALPEPVIVPDYGTEVSFEIHWLDEDGSPGPVVGFAQNERVARLLSAAPGMLNALKAVTETIGTSDALPYHLKQDIEAIIAQATGEARS